MIPCWVFFVCHLWFLIIFQPTTDFLLLLSLSLSIYFCHFRSFFFILGFHRDWILCSLPRCHGYPMLIVLQYALSWPDLLVSDICFVCLFLENIPHVCEPYRDTTLSLLFMLWFLFDNWCIFTCSISSTDSMFQFNLWMNRCVHKPSSFTMSRCLRVLYARMDAMVSHMCFSVSFLK